MAHLSNLLQIDANANEAAHAVGCPLDSLLVAVKCLLTYHSRWLLCMVHTSETYDLLEMYPLPMTNRVPRVAHMQLDN